MVTNLRNTVTVHSFVLIVKEDFLLISIELANFRAHYEVIGPEIWEQTNGNLDAFVAAAGTGGTVAGVSKFLQEKNPNVKCFLVDPLGSDLFNKVTRGVMYTKEGAEGRRLKNPFDTITKGIGINSVDLPKRRHKVED